MSEPEQKTNDLKYDYLAKNTILFAISSFGSKLLVFLLVPFYTSVLSKAEYGIADLITTTSNILVIVATICISDAVTRFSMDGLEARKGVFRYGVSVEIIAFILTGIVIFFVADINPFDWDVSYYFLLWTIMCTSAFYQLVSNYLRAIDKVGCVAIMGILVTLLTIVSNLTLLLLYKLGLLGYLISLVAGYAISAVYGLVNILKYDRKCLAQICNVETRKGMIRFSLPLIFNGVAWWINSGLDRYLLLFFLGTEANGLYAAASKIPTILSIITQIFGQAWSLSAIKESTSENKEGFYKNIYEIYNGVLVCACSILIIFNVPIAKILFAKEFFQAWHYSSVLLISAVFSALGAFWGSFFSVQKKTGWYAVSTVISACINLILNSILIPKYGIMGASIATGFSFFAMYIIRYFAASKFIKLGINLIKDLSVYILIIMQIIIANTDKHGYWIQIPICLLILLLYRKPLLEVFKYISSFWLQSWARLMKGDNNGENK